MRGVDGYGVVELAAVASLELGITDFPGSERIWIRHISPRQESGGSQTQAGDRQQDRPGIPRVAGVAVASHAVDRDRLELEVWQGCAPEPTDGLDRLAREFAGAEEPEEPLPDPERLTVVQEEDPGSCRASRSPRTRSSRERPGR